MVKEDVTDLTGEESKASTSTDNGMPPVLPLSTLLSMSAADWSGMTSPAVKNEHTEVKTEPVVVKKEPFQRPTLEPRLKTDEEA